MQLCKQHNDGKCFIAFDLPDQRRLRSYNFREHKIIRGKQNKSHLTYQHALARSTPFSSTVPALVIPLQIRVIEVWQSE